ncbi:MAG: VOC family protein [Burkholderiales bacterium]|nr:VOC family protein [Burkholderiales bacterium]
MQSTSAVPDHLVVAAATLDGGCDWVAERLGARPQPGGRHVAMGTHNALLRLGPRVYLEVIAIDPAAAAPTRARWFDLDQATMRAALAEGPRLVHWVARTGNLDDAVARLPALGAITPMQRGVFTWRITIPDDGHLPARGLVPTLIQWFDGQHPADGLPDHGLSLTLLAGEHPEPATVRSALAALGLGDVLKVTYARTARLAAMIRTRRGTVAL